MYMLKIYEFTIFLVYFNLRLMSKQFCWRLCIQIILLLRYMILVCGTGALCLTRIHRPLCVCPDGFDGNPYDKCEEVTFFEPRRYGDIAFYVLLSFVL